MRILAVIIFLISANAFAQSVFVPLQIINRFSSNEKAMNIYQPVYMYNGGSTESQRYIFKVILKSGEEIKCRSRIDFSNGDHTISIRRGRANRTFTASETKALIRMPDVSQDNFLEGIPTDSCWLFKTKHAKLNCYSYLPEGETCYLAAVQDGDGRILSISKENLIAVMRNPDERTLKLIYRGNFIAAVNRYNEIK